MSYRCALHPDLAVAVGGDVGHEPTFLCSGCQRNADIIDDLVGPLEELAAAAHAACAVLRPGVASTRLTGGAAVGKATPRPGVTVTGDGVPDGVPVCNGCGHEMDWHNGYGCQQLGCICAARGPR